MKWGILCLPEPELDWTFLERMADLIAHEAFGLCCVCYDLTPNPTGTVEWE